MRSLSRHAPTAVISNGFAPGIRVLAEPIPYPSAPVILRHTFRLSEPVPEPYTPVGVAVAGVKGL
jgi:hypothetical protein